MGLITEQPQSTPPCQGCASTTRLQQMTNKRRRSSDTAGFTCAKEWYTHLSYCGHGAASYGTGLRLSRIGREPQNVECSSRTSWITKGTTIPTGTATTSFLLASRVSTTGDRSNVSRPTAEGQGEQGSSDLARHNAEDLNNTRVLQSVRMWTDKTDDNADVWDAAIRHFNKVSVSSCFLMEIDRGCLQPSVFDDSIFAEYIGSLVKNTAGIWDFAVKTNVSQNRCRVFGKSPWLDFSCDDDVWLHQQATMNRAQNSFVDEQLVQYSQHTTNIAVVSQRQCRYEQRRHTTCLTKAESASWIFVMHQTMSSKQFANT